MINYVCVVISEYSEIILLTYKLKHIICLKYTIYSLNGWSESSLCF